MLIEAWTSFLQNILGISILYSDVCSPVSSGGPMFCHQLQCDSCAMCREPINRKPCACNFWACHVLLYMHSPTLFSCLDLSFFWGWPWFGGPLSGRPDLWIGRMYRNSSLALYFRVVLAFFPFGMFPPQQTADCCSLRVVNLYWFILTAYGCHVWPLGFHFFLLTVIHVFTHVFICLSFDLLRN